MPTLHYQNPLLPGYFADPFVWRHDGRCFAIGTGGAEASGHVDASTRPTVFPLLTSPDLVNWTPAGHAPRELQVSATGLLSPGPTWTPQALALRSSGP